MAHEDSQVAQTEIGEATAFFDSVHPGLGNEFKRELRDTVRQTARMPLAWVCVGPRTRRRLLTRFPYQVIYAVLPDTFLVLAVGHQHRRPDYWHDRLGQFNSAP